MSVEHLSDPGFLLRADALFAAKPQRDTLYSEDLNHGQVYEGLKVVNPFL